MTPSKENRLETLAELLRSGIAGTQDEICENLRKSGFNATQSTISRDLRKLGAIKAIDDQGRTVYKAPPEAPSPPSLASASLGELVFQVETNGYLIVVKTAPGSASLIASHIDHLLPRDLLGTIAGDDTVFIAPVSVKTIRKTVEAIRRSLGVQ